MEIKLNLKTPYISTLTALSSEIKKNPKRYVILGGILLFIVLTTIVISNLSSKELVKVTVYDTKEVYIEPTGKSDIQFEVGMYDNPNMYHFSDFPIKLRIDNTSTDEEAIELGEKMTKEIKKAIDDHFPGTDYSVKTYVYHTEFDELGNSNPTTSEELTTIDSGGIGNGDDKYK